jgi:hypothetical protein
MNKYTLGWWSKKLHSIDIYPTRKWWHNLLNVNPKPIGTESIKSWDWTEIDICFSSNDECQKFIDELSTINKGGIGSPIRQIMAGGYDKGIYDMQLVSCGRVKDG